MMARTAVRIEADRAEPLKEVFVTCTVLSFFKRCPEVATAQVCGLMSWRQFAAAEVGTALLFEQGYGRGEASSSCIVGCSANTESEGESVPAAGGAGGRSGCRQRFCPRCTVGAARRHRTGQRGKRRSRAVRCKLGSEDGMQASESPVQGRPHMSGGNGSGA